MTNTSALNEALDQFFEHVLAKYSFDGDDRLWVEHDPEWPSPCEVGPWHKNSVGWKPVLREEPGDFSDLEKAVGLDLHPDIKTYYGRYFSEGIDCRAPDGDLSMIQVWSDKDFERLQTNIVGHLMMKDKLGQRQTVFFAHTDEEDLFLSIVNETGEVVLERPGMEPHKVLADNLATFINQLTL